MKDAMFSGVEDGGKRVGEAGREVVKVDGA